jgi:uncharacterized protein
MKKLWLLCFMFLMFMGVCFPQTYPEATGYVVDTVGVLKPDTKAIIEQECKELDFVAQVAVAIVKTTQPLTDTQYGIKLAEKWKVGYKGKDNGVIFLIVTGDRQVRIETGRGIEAILTDAKCGWILDTAVVPYLRQNNWNDGILSGFRAIKKEILNASR